MPNDEAIANRSQRLPRRRKEPKTKQSQSAQRRDCRQLLEDALTIS